MPVQSRHVHECVHDSLVKININQTPKNAKTEKNDLFEGRDLGLFSIIELLRARTPITIKFKLKQKLCVAILHERFGSTLKNSQTSITFCFKFNFT